MAWAREREEEREREALEAADFLAALRGSSQDLRVSGAVVRAAACA
jgi:hypothetical protein